MILRTKNAEMGFIATTMISQIDAQPYDKRHVTGEVRSEEVREQSLQRGSQDLNRVKRRPAGEMLDLLAATGAVGADQRAGRRVDGWNKPVARHCL